MFVVGFGIKNYLLNKQISLAIKICHLLITFLIFQYYFIDFRNMLWQIIRQKTIFNNVCQFDFITSILYLFNCAFVSGLALNIAMKARSRKLFLFSSPFIVSITSLDLYSFILIDYELESTGVSTFFIILFIMSFIFTLINLYYNFPGKKVFVESFGEH
jgi:hypothetical protein